MVDQIEIRAWVHRGVRGLIVLTLLGLLTMSLPALMTGTPALAVLGVNASPDQIAAFMASLNLDRPAPERLWEWLSNAAGGDLGASLVTGRSLTDELAARLPITIELLLLGQVVALALTLPVAMASAWRPGGLLDRIATVTAFVLLSVPTFVFGLLGIILFSVMLGLLPATGWVPFGIDPIGHLRHLVLPVLTIGLAEAAVLVRVLRADLITTMREPYVLASRSRGMGTARLMITRVLRPSSLTTMTLVGLGFGALFGGSALIETVFAIPGMGRLAVTAIGARDFPVIEMIVIFSGIAVFLAALAVDILYTFVDPRTRRAHARS